MWIDKGVLFSNPQSAFRMFVFRQSPRGACQNAPGLAQ
jgi:hypothetical protein